MGMKITKNREGNYDLLRVICAIAVVAIHVSATYKGAITSEKNFGELYTSHIGTIVFYDIFSRFAVPCFVMLSGAFLLADDRNMEFGRFYRKAFKSIGLPTIVFTLIYFLDSEIQHIIKIMAGNEEWSSMISPLQAIWYGRPYYHMWYLYTLMGVYFLIPVVILVKKEIGEKKFEKISWIILVLATISGWTSKFKLEWSLSKAVCYLGFLMIGYVLRSKAKQKCNFKGMMLILCGMISLFVLALIQYQHSMQGIAESSEKISLNGNFNPLVVVASVFIFAGFSKISFYNRIAEHVAGLTFWIYLIHVGVWDKFMLFFKPYGNRSDCRIVIPAAIAGLFLISYVFSLFFDKFWKRVNSKAVRYSASDKL